MTPRGNDEISQRASAATLSGTAVLAGREVPRRRNTGSARLAEPSLSGRASPLISPSCKFVVTITRKARSWKNKRRAKIYGMPHQRRYPRCVRAHSSVAAWLQRSSNNIGSRLQHELRAGRREQAGPVLVSRFSAILGRRGFRFLDYTRHR